MTSLQRMMAAIRGEPFDRYRYPALLKRAGHRTGLIGKLGVTCGGTQTGDDPGATEEMFDVCDNFEHWGPDPNHREMPDGTKRHLTDITGDKAVEFLRECASDHPWCLSLSFNAPHAQDHVPDPHIYPPSAERPDDRGDAR